MLCKILEYGEYNASPKSGRNSIESMLFCRDSEYMLVNAPTKSHPQTK